MRQYGSSYYEDLKYACEGRRSWNYARIYWGFLFVANANGDYISQFNPKAKGPKQNLTKVFKTLPSNS